MSILQSIMGFSCFLVEYQSTESIMTFEHFFLTLDLCFTTVEGTSTQPIGTSPPLIIVISNIFLRRYAETGTLLRKGGSGRPSKVTTDVLAIVDEKMKEDDETTAHQLHKLPNERGHQISISTIMRCRKELGWTFRGSAYCQMIREENKMKHKEWALQYLSEALADNGFKNVIWTDESSIQIETHKRYCYRQKDCPPKRKPR